MPPKLRSDDIRKEDVIQAVIIDDCLNQEFYLEGKPSVHDPPKSLFPLANIPLVDYSLAALNAAGVQETILFCGARADQLKQHINKSQWNDPGSMTVKVMVSERCQSMGDAMRELDASNVIQGDFILMYADTVVNAKLIPILQKHRSITQKDKGAVMTMVYTKAGPGHASRSLEKETVLAIDKRNGRILSHQKVFQQEAKISLPLELFLDRPCVEVCYDLLDPCISICSLTVPPLFSDNFDFQTRDDLVRGLLINEDILGQTMYCHCLENEYAARVSNLGMYQAISMDVIHRWTYPLVPDAGFAPECEKYMYLHKNNVYKQPNVIITGKNTIEDSVIGGGTKIGSACTISCSVIGRNCQIGDNVSLHHTFLMDQVSVQNNFKGNSFLAPKKQKISSTVDGKTNCKLIAIPCHDKKDQQNKNLDGYGSDTDSSDNGSQGNANVVDEYEVFFSEVLDSLVRGFKEKVELDALIIEINASRFANNIPADEVNHWVVRAILNVPENAGHTLDKVLVFFKPILQRYVSKSVNDQHQCLTAIEHEVLGGPKQLLPSCSKLLMFLYDKDILEEEAILKWHNEDADEEMTGLKQVKDFITWLQNAEEESDESSE